MLHIDACPNWQVASDHVRESLHALGRDDVDITEVLITNSDEAAAVAFAGSPTILVDGVDLFPSGGRTTDLACRIYPTETGFAGVPSREQLESALRSRL